MREELEVPLGFARESLDLLIRKPEAASSQSPQEPANSLLRHDWRLEEDRLLLRGSTDLTDCLLSTGSGSASLERERERERLQRTLESEREVLRRRVERHESAKQALDRAQEELRQARTELRRERSKSVFAFVRDKWQRRRRPPAADGGSPRTH